MQKPVYGPDFKLGILGGGQLGRMLIPEAIDLDVHVHVLDPSADAPCAAIAHTFTVGDFRDYDAVMDFGRDKDLITIEIEDVNTRALHDLKKLGVRVCPDPAHIDLIKDKGTQKAFYEDNQIPTSPFRLIDSGRSLTIKDLPCVLKARTGGYDGKGVMVLKNESDLQKAFDAPCVVEHLVAIEKELSVIVARNASGETATFPVVELVFDPVANLVDYLFAPAMISNDLAERAQQLALQVADAFSFTGILAVEMFLTASGEILVNEVAPRTHNSGHHTIEGNLTSQFGQHLRAILDLPLGSTETLRPSAMVNLVGEPGFEGKVRYQGLEDVLKLQGAYPHFYGKTSTKPYRKMGHVTVVANEVSELAEAVKKVKQLMKVIS